MKKLLGLCTLSLAMFAGSTYAYEVGLFCSCVSSNYERDLADAYCDQLNDNNTYPRVNRIKTGTPGDGVRYPSTYPAIDPPTTVMPRNCDSYLNGTASCTQAITAAREAPEMAYACFGDEKVLIIR